MGGVGVGSPENIPPFAKRCTVAVVGDGSHTPHIRRNREGMRDSVCLERREE